MQPIVWLVRGICGLNTLLGRIFGWFSLAIVVVCFTVVIQRYVFATSYVWMQELYVWLNGAMFTAIAGYALLRDEHVRVDIFYRTASVRNKAKVDLIGVLAFLLPYCWVIWSWGLPYVQRSWRFYEASSNTGGMPGLFILKTFILVFAVLLALQGVAMIGRSILVLAGREESLPPALRYQTGKE